MAKNYKQVLVEVALADRFKVVLCNKNIHGGCFYPDDEWDITIYASTIKDLIAQAIVAMVSRLIRVDGWDLEQCQVLIYDGNLYEVENSAKSIKKDYSTLVDDIISTDSYKQAYKTRKDEHAVELRKLKKRYREKEKKEYEERKARKKK